MKKRLLLVVLTMGIVCGTSYMRRPEFWIYQSFSVSGPSYTNTSASFIVNRGWYDETLPDRAEKWFEKINGTPTTLEMRFYYSEWHLHHGEPYKIVSCEYGDKNR